MTKVLKEFFCVQTATRYKRGDDYKGSRKDLSHFLEIEDKKSPVAKGKKTVTKKKPNTKN